MNRSLLSLAGCTLLTLGCADGAPVATDLAEAVAAAKPVSGPAVVEGTTGPGADYALFLPAPWNGDLVIYSHGYVGPNEPIALPQVDPLPEILNGLGFGVAFSSFSENGYAIKDAVQRTRQLRGIFASHFGMPEKTYLAGHSEGALITLMLAEKNANLFDGALPMCGLVGGGPMQVEYILNVRVLFDAFFPGVIPGTPFAIPPGLDFETQVVPAVTFAMASDPLRAIDMAGVDQIEIQWTSLPELVESVLNALFYNIVGIEDLLGRTHGRIMVGNEDTFYSGSSNDALLNASVRRFEATPDAANYLEQWYQPTGKLTIPVVTLHTTRDGAVPFSHEPAYAELAATAGGSDMLVQRAVNGFGHCNFTIPEQINAFLDLVTWVETGLKPLP
jgi:pimeloyl-ACP methyl ester carboxylesterase